MRRSLRFLAPAVLVLAGAVSFGQSNVLEVEIGSARGGDFSAADAAVREFNKDLARLSRNYRLTNQAAGLTSDRIQFSMPSVVWLTQNGKRLAPPEPSGPRNGAPLVLQFDNSGSRAFPAEYRQVLESVFNTAQTTLTAIFGPPSVGGVVRVLNFDADIGDRDAVAGGYYVPNNGMGQPEIRFPVYNAPETAAVNFIHCLLLAYLGPSGYEYDALSEGLVRATTIRVSRIPAALPAQFNNPASRETIELVLANSYDVGAFYDWNNQRALGGRRFIAPNLRNVPLPPGGSLGGIFLLRYQMAGSAWQKVLVEYPSFPAEINSRAYLNPAIRTDIGAFLTAAQASIDAIGGSGSTVEGLPFADWFARQYILQTYDTLGLKLLMRVIPLTSELGPNEFSVFIIEGNYFETRAGGNELLLSGTAFPIFWEPSFNRVFPSTQDDRMTISGAYGAVVPTFPNLFSGSNYRMAVDLPVADRLARVYLPVGAIARGSSAKVNNFYGTVIGAENVPGGSISVRLTYGSGQNVTIPVQNGAFGERIDSEVYNLPGRTEIRVIRTVSGVETTLLTRRVNKALGALGVDLKVDANRVFQLVDLPLGLSMIGVPVQTLSSSPSELLNVPVSQLLVARYNAARLQYDLWPDSGAFERGFGYFVRMPARQTVNLPGTVDPRIPVSVALRPGWNMVSVPNVQNTSLGNITVTVGTAFPVSFSDAIGSSLGADFFEFQQDGANPDTGSMIPANSFQAGRGYFVRCLSSTGATLTFFPSGMVGNRAGPPPPVAPEPEPGFYRFLGEFRVTRAKTSVSAQFGQHSAGTMGFDPRLDSQLPPGLGGLQASFGAGNPQFRQVVGMKDKPDFIFKIEGLHNGKPYQLRYTSLVSKAPPIQLFPISGGQPIILQPGQEITLMANGTTAQFIVRAASGGTR
jgi:hypothetical protein